jgi:hypothetical protein
VNTAKDDSLWCKPMDYDIEIEEKSRECGGTL